MERSCFLFLILIARFAWVRTLQSCSVLEHLFVIGPRSWAIASYQRPLWCSRSCMSRQFGQGLEILWPSRPFLGCDDVIN
jgi:hypothetical protein